MTLAEVTRRVREHAFVAALALGIVLGGGLRFVPAGTAAGASSGQSTSCAATK